MKMECQLKEITKKEEDMFRELLVDGEHPLSSIIHSMKNESHRQNITQVSVTKVNTFEQQEKFDIAVDIMDCNFCKRIFKNAGDKEQHERSHYVFTCEVCYTVFRRKCDLEKYLSGIHNVKTDQGAAKAPKSKTLYFECQIRFKAFVSDDNLKKHMLVQHQQREGAQIKEEITRNHPAFADTINNMLFRQDGMWHCSCGKMFKDKGHAKDHCETHVEGLCYPCPNVGCGKWYGKSVGLRAHRRICRVAPLKSL
jgi:hypothetical protein